MNNVTSLYFKRYRVRINMTNEEMQATNISEQSACDSTIQATSNSIRARKFTKKPTVINRRKTSKCSVCKKTMRSDHLKRHITAKHNDVFNTAEHHMKPSDAYANKPATNGKMPYKSYDRKVTNATSCASTTVASALHWAFKHVHDETVMFLESDGEREASKRITNLLVLIEEQLANMLDQEFNRVANVQRCEPMTHRHQYEQLY